jgi:hypothetical protein
MNSCKKFHGLPSVFSHLKKKVSSSALFATPWSRTGELGRPPLAHNVTLGKELVFSFTLQGKSSWYPLSRGLDGPQEAYLGAVKKRKKPFRARIQTQSWCDFICTISTDTYTVLPRQTFCLRIWSQDIKCILRFACFGQLFATEKVFLYFTITFKPHKCYITFIGEISYTYRPG